ncbi:MAG: M24 family metallopeptidase [Aestuariibacter sp.]|uniref:Metallopeptidase n=1 Tax=Thalassotalea eurytherma TaxID=1144278 RepID=A0ABQ6H4J6_9GAMM|nr:Xaa-Pro peptidase family protein [Thalassotalea eurytherma]GLX83078.1 metallopeptidase [Thalassotalea eurytherma]
MQNTKRTFLKQSAVALASLGLVPIASASSTSTSNSSQNALRDLTSSVKPISSFERLERIKKAQKLMSIYDINVLVLEPGASMTYFSDLKWWRSERLTSVVIPREGNWFVVCPEFEVPTIQESINSDIAVVAWNEHQSPYKALAQHLKSVGVVKGNIGFEESVRYFVFEGIMNELPSMNHVSADPVTQGCRMFKSKNELQLMRKANEITLAAYNYVYSNLEEGMTGKDIKSLMNSAQTQLGGDGVWSMALSNESSALPHGTKKPQILKKGSIILMDSGCNVHEYRSDISRTFVFGEPSNRHRKIWNTVRKGQDIVFKTAQIGVLATNVDDAVRSFYESEGFGPGYATPGLSHRTGHGIGMEIHEEINFVHGEKTKLKAGMCFSNEPGIYIPGEFGVRIEDCIYLTEGGPQYFTNPPKSIEEPLGTIGPEII